jgi:cytochrome c peroxidase
MKSGPYPVVKASELAFGRALALLAAAVALCASGAVMGNPDTNQPFSWNLPKWVPPPIVPADNPMSRDKAELGRHLFYDTGLSANRAMSCATCHSQAKAFTDGRATPVGVTGEKGVRSAMSLANTAYLPMLTWANPQVTSLEKQALIPLFGEHPVEMGMAGREKEIFARFKSMPTYRELFSKAYPAEAAQGDEALYSLSTMTRALASFQRGLMSFDSPYDQFKYGHKPNAITPAAKRGEKLFFGEKMECYHCHGGFNFTDNMQHMRLPHAERGFHNTGLYNLDGKGAYPANNPGIAEFTGDEADMGKFRTPSLRNIAVTAPYMHDGSISTLQQVIRLHYALGGRAAGQKQGANPLRSGMVVGFEVSAKEVVDLTAFLKSLTDAKFLQDPAFGDPWKR